MKIISIISAVLSTLVFYFLIKFIAEKTQETILNLTLLVLLTVSMYLFFEVRGLTRFVDQIKLIADKKAQEVQTGDLSGNDWGPMKYEDWMKKMDVEREAKKYDLKKRANK